MKIIDYMIKGNQVKFYLGNDNCKDYWGDDWNDRPYEHNAGSVYDEYIRGTKIISFDFDDVVVEPCDGEYNSPYSKEDMKNRNVPCVCVLKKEYITDDMWNFDFKNIVGNKNVISYYFGDDMEPDEIIKEKTEKKYLHIHYETDIEDEKRLLITTIKTLGASLNAVLLNEQKRDLIDDAKSIYENNTEAKLKKYFYNIFKQIQKMYFNKANIDADMFNKIKFEIVSLNDYYKISKEGYIQEDIFVNIESNDIYDIGSISYGKKYK